MERFRAVVSVRPESLGAVPKMRPGCARFRHSSLHALRSSSGSGLPSGSTRTRTRTLFKPNSQGRGRANAAVMYAMLSLLFCTLARCALPLLCLAAVLQPTALPSVEITKLDSHLRYCTLTATPPAFHHSAQAATPMPVASLRLLTRLDSAATAALPGMLSDTSRRVALTRCVREQVCKAGFSPASHVRSAGCIPP